jgi:hypothetical protein
MRRRDVGAQVDALGTSVIWAKFYGYPWWPAQIVELSVLLPVTASILKR